jgi:hypothetical protein
MPTPDFESAMMDALINVGDIVRRQYKKTFDLGNLTFVVPLSGMKCQCGQPIGMVFYQEGMLMMCVGKGTVHSEIITRPRLEKFIKMSSEIKPKTGVKIKKMSKRDVKKMKDGEKLKGARLDLGYA